MGWTPLHMFVVFQSIGNIDAIALLLAAGASPSLKTPHMEKTPLEYADRSANKRLLPMFLRSGSPLPRARYTQWMEETGSEARAKSQYIAKVAAAGSWAAYERQHRARLARTFVPKFPRLPPDVIPTIVAFGFHTGDY